MFVRNKRVRYVNVVERICIICVQRAFCSCVVQSIYYLDLLQCGLNRNICICLKFNVLWDGECRKWWRHIWQIVYLSIREWVHDRIVWNRNIQNNNNSDIMAIRCIGAHKDTSAYALNTSKSKRLYTFVRSFFIQNQFN